MAKNQLGGFSSLPPVLALTPKTGFEVEGRSKQDVSRGFPGLFAVPFRARLPFCVFSKEDSFAAPSLRTSPSGWKLSRVPLKTC